MTDTDERVTLLDAGRRCTPGQLHKRHLAAPTLDGNKRPERGLQLVARGGGGAPCSALFLTSEILTTRCENGPIHDSWEEISEVENTIAASLRSSTLVRLTAPRRKRIASQEIT
ncbi:hypothetical protein GCM10022381_39880 [Leifsonia kafniensis]|uniref:Uncharacterized protein n=1 Tax=Leifsonia kafniensis TaxID=475957 RepID=A0ABP7L846_9MICO